MRWFSLLHRKPAVGHATPEASHAVFEAHRVLQDAQAVRRLAGERLQKADEVASRLEDTTRRNHFGEAVARTMRRNEE